MEVDIGILTDKNKDNDASSKSYESIFSVEKETIEAESRRDARLSSANADIDEQKLCDKMC